jgi:peroxiredoxin
MKKLLPLCCMLMLLATAALARRKSPAPVIGQSVADFSLRNIDGKLVSLNSFPAARGFIIVFTCNHCPFAKLYTKRLNDLNRKYKVQGVPLLAINPMDTVVYEEESYALMQERARDSAYAFPYLQDGAQAVAAAFKATHTPHAFIIWKEQQQWIIRYAGAIDDNGTEPAKAHSLIAKAADELLKGKPVSQPQTQSLGCAINYR